MVRSLMSWRSDTPSSWILPLRVILARRSILLRGSARDASRDASVAGSRRRALCSSLRLRTGELAWRGGLLRTLRSAAVFCFAGFSEPGLRAAAGEGGATSFFSSLAPAEGAVEACWGTAGAGSGAAACGGGGDDGGAAEGAGVGV